MRLSCGEPEVVADARQSDVHHGGVEHDHELRDADHGQGEPAVAGQVRGWCFSHGWCISHGVVFRVGGREGSCGASQYGEQHAAHDLLGVEATGGLAGHENALQHERRHEARGHGYVDVGAELAAAPGALEHVGDARDARLGEAGLEGFEQVGLAGQGGADAHHHLQQPLRVRAARRGDHQLDVAVERAGVDGVDGGLEGRHRIDDELSLAAPSTVDGGLSYARCGSDGLHGQAVVAVAQEEVDRRVDDRLVAARVSGPASGALLGEGGVGRMHVLNRTTKRNGSVS